MFGIGFWELVVVGLVAVILIKPDDLPTLSYRAGLFFAQAKKLLAQLQYSLTPSYLTRDDKTPPSPK